MKRTKYFIFFSSPYYSVWGGIRGFDTTKKKEKKGKTNEPMNYHFRRGAKEERKKKPTTKKKTKKGEKEWKYEKPWESYVRALSQPRRSKEL